VRPNGLCAWRAAFEVTVSAIWTGVDAVLGRLPLSCPFAAGVSSMGASTYAVRLASSLLAVLS